MSGKLSEDWICDGCGKDPYKSSTGCLCHGHGKGGQWRLCKPGEKGTAGPPPPPKKMADVGPVTCKCGAIRTTAIKDPSRALPCDKCGAVACDVASLQENK